MAGENVLMYIKCSRIWKEEKIIPRRYMKGEEIEFLLTSIDQLTVLPRALLSILLGLYDRNNNYFWLLPSLHPLYLYHSWILLFLPFSLLSLFFFFLYCHYPSIVHPASIYLVYGYQINISNNYFQHVTAHPLKNLHCLEYQSEASLSEKWEPSTVQLHATCINFISQYCLKHTLVSDRAICRGTSPTMPSTFLL